MIVDSRVSIMDEAFHNRPPPSATGDRRPIDDSPLSGRVRELRRRRGWTLDELAERSGVSRSMLSQIERGRANPTVGIAVRIARGLGAPIADLVESPPSERIEVIRTGDEAAVYRRDDAVVLRTLSPLHLERDVELYELTLQPGGSLDSAAHFRGTREVLTVERGRVSVSSGSDRVELGPGDSAHYPADVPHAIANVGRGPAVAFMLVIEER
jgi:transcriptional regulator with XRE-family HTH domain